MEVVVLADTHLRAGWDPVPAALRQAISQADVVLHAGDVVSPRALEELHAMARRAHVVRGNNDHDLVGVLPESSLLELGGVPVALLHDSGPSRGRAGRLHRRFPGAALVVFGHSHVPVNEAGLAGQWLFNPGSPTQRRRQPHRTFGRLRLSGGVVERAELEVVAAA